MARGQSVRVRLATLAPRGTSLHKTLLAMGEEWRQAPCGGVKHPGQAVKEGVVEGMPGRTNVKLFTLPWP